MADADSKTVPAYGLTADQVDRAMSDADIVQATLDVAMFALEANGFIDRYSDMEEYIPENIREDFSMPANQLPLQALLATLRDARQRAERLFDTVGKGVVHLGLDARMQDLPSTTGEPNELLSNLVYGTS